MHCSQRRLRFSDREPVTTCEFPTPMITTDTSYLTSTVCSDSLTTLLIHKVHRMHLQRYGEVSGSQQRVVSQRRSEAAKAKALL